MKLTKKQEDMKNVICNEFLSDMGDLDDIFRSKQLSERDELAIRASFKEDYEEAVADTEYKG